MAKTKIKTFDCTVRLAGDVQNSVPKKGITAAELILLASLHGQDAILHIKEVGEVEMDKRALYKKLYDAYTRTPDLEAMFLQTFGNELNPNIPDDIPESIFEILSETSDDAAPPAPGSQEFKDEMEKVKIKAILDERGDSYAWNAGLSKLREALELSDANKDAAEQAKANEGNDGQGDGDANVPA